MESDKPFPPASAPASVPSKPIKDEHGKLIAWAKGKSLHIDPKTGRADSAEKKAARASAQELIRHADEEEREGSGPPGIQGFGSWRKERAAEHATNLKKLKAKV